MANGNLYFREYDPDYCTYAGRSQSKPKECKRVKHVQWKDHWVCRFHNVKLTKGKIRG